ncbi:MAG: enoyl-CoA hydratase/isomerase family protein [Syntrophaceae bacterium]|nr:enoyl-CoA hydratase/isomerase family protein [Syntrophaceae bacterium]
MSGFATLIYEKEGPVAQVTLNRPASLNAYNIQMRNDLFEVLTAIRDDPEVRVVLFTGAGEKAFCAGADLSEFLTAPSPTIARQVRFGRDLWGLFLSLPQPLIAALHGYVIGSGIEIALCCDIRIAAADTEFRMPEVGLGIIPGAGGTQMLPRIIGRARALEILLTGRWLESEEAQRIGLVSEIVSGEALLPRAWELAHHIASLPAKAVRNAKAAVVRGGEMPLAEGLLLERRLSADTRRP